ncbi:MAG: hypothetical protein AAF726_09180 [Planctomycetota bacterium]
MAVEVEASSQVEEFLRILRKRIWWIVVPTAMIGSIGVFFAVVVPKKYVSESQVTVLNVGQMTGELGETAASAEGENAAINIKSPKRISSVLEALKWGEYVSLGNPEKEAYRDRVITDIAVSANTGGRTGGQASVELSYKDTDAERAVEFLTALQESWTTEVLQRNLRQKEKEEQETDETLMGNRRRLEEIATQKNEIRAENQIPPPLQTPDGMLQRQPKAFGEAGEVDGKISQYEGELLEMDDLLIELVEKRDRLPVYVDESEILIDDPIGREIDQIDAKIAELEFKIDSGGWAPGHTSRSMLEAEIRGYRKRRDEKLVERDSSSLDSSVDLQNPSRLKLTEEIRDLEVRIENKRKRRDYELKRKGELRQETQRLNDAFKTLEVLEAEKGEIEEASKSLKRRVDNLRIEIRALNSEEGNPFDVIKEPTTPTKPSSPNPWIISIGSIIFGLGLGLALAVLVEYSKNCFRSSRELNRVMPHPVLGTINMIRTRKERAKGALARALLAGGSLAFVVGMGFVTWAWAKKPGALNDSLVRAIDEFRRMLM